MRTPTKAIADAYEIYHSSSTSKSLTFSGGELKTREDQSDTGYGIRIIKNKKIGFGYCESPEKINKTIKDASKLSRFSLATNFCFPKKSKFPLVNIYDKKIASISANELKSILDQIKDSAQKYSTLVRVNISSDKELISLKNTSGLNASYKYTNLSAYSEVMDGNGFGFSQYNSNHMIKDPVSMGQEAAEMAKLMRHPKKLSAGKYTVVFHPEAMASLLDILLPSFSGDWERKDISKLCGKRKTKVFSELFTLSDNGKAPTVGARPFDDEGIPSKKRLLIDKGVVKTFAYNLENAALVEKNYSGFCNRSHYSTHPVCGFSNIVISPGDYQNFEQELGKHLVIYSAHGSHTANLTTGDFGLEVNTAFLKKGKRSIPVRGFMLVGNVFDLFSNIYGIEKKQISYGSILVPNIAFKDVRVVS